MRTYTQLTQEQRYQIYALLKMGHLQFEIAKVIGVHKSTINSELSRNRGLKGYRPKQAHQFALNRREKVRHRIEASIWILIDALIRNGARRKYRISLRITTVFKSALNGSTSTFSWINMREEISIVTYDASRLTWEKAQEALWEL